MLFFTNSRDRSYLSAGDRILREDLPGRGIWRRSPALPLEACIQLTEEHLRCLQEHRTVKRDRKRNITRITREGVSYIVKDFIPVRRPEFLCPARKSWLGSHYLEGCTAPALGWFHSRKEGDFIIFQDGGPGNFFEGSYLGDSDAESLYEHAGMLLAELHSRGLYHADTKPSNFIRNSLIPELHRKVLLIDCDKVLIYAGAVPEKRRLKNLAQFAGGCRNITDLRQWRCLMQAFYRGYSSGMRMSGDEDRLFLQKLTAVLEDPGYKVENYLTGEQIGLMKAYAANRQ